jgi:hypothetical protein
LCWRTERRNDLAQKCPACGYRRRAKDDALFPDWQCPQCKRAYAKTELRDLRESFAQGEDIPSSPSTSRSPGRVVTAHGRGAIRESEGFGILLLVIPVAAASLPWYWMLSATLIEGAAWKLAGLTVLMIFATSLATAFDAAHLAIGSKHDVTPNGRKRPGPVFWSLVVLLFWAVGYPAYLYWRSRYGARSLAAAGIAIVLMFSGTVAILGKKMQQASEPRGLALPETKVAPLIPARLVDGNAWPGPPSRMA